MISMYPPVQLTHTLTVSLFCIATDSNRFGKGRIIKHLERQIVSVVYGRILFLK